MNDEQVNPAFLDAKRRLAPLVLEILHEYVPWVLIPDKTAARDRMMFDDEKLYSTRELARKLGISEKTLHNRVHRAKAGEEPDSPFLGLVSRKLGRDRVYQGRDLNSWWESKREVLGGTDEQEDRNL